MRIPFRVPCFGGFCTFTLPYFHSFFHINKKSPSLEDDELRSYSKLRLYFWFLILHEQVTGFQIQALLPEDECSLLTAFHPRPIDEQFICTALNCRI